MSKKLHKESQKLALGYLRISDKKQIQGESKNTQRATIQTYADRNNIKIIDWFYDEAKSGKNTDREELHKLLRLAVRYKGKIDYVIVYKMNRANRNLESYVMTIKSILGSRGIRMRSATEQFDDSPMGKYIEHTYVMLGELDNDVKRETVIDNMTAIARQGYWQHGPIRGYDKCKIKNSDGNKRPSMSPNQEAELVKKVLMRFNIGDMSEADMVRYATSINLFNRQGKPLTQEVIHTMLTRPEYAGYVHDKFTDYELVDGKHQGIIDTETYWQNQEINKRKNKAYLLGLKHHAINEQAPLRRFILCVNCNKHMTSSNPGGVYRYYCARKSCRKTGSVTTSEAHSRFEQVLANITPTEGTLTLLKEILARTAVKELGAINEELSSARARLDEISSTRISAIRKNLSKVNPMSDDDLELLKDSLDEEKLTIMDDITRLESRQTVGEASIDYALNFMRDMSSQWNHAPLELRQKIQSLIFPSGFVYDIKTIIL